MRGPEQNPNHRERLWNSTTRLEDFASEPTTRRGFLTLAAALRPHPLMWSAASVANELFHVVIFRFAKEHVNDATAGFRPLASHPGKSQDVSVTSIHRGIDDDEEFMLVEHWASQAARRRTGGRTEAFTHFGHL